MWAFHLRLFSIVRPSSFRLVTTSIGLLLMVTASKDLGDFEKLIWHSLHLDSFNWNLSALACLTSSSTATWIPHAWPLWTVFAIDDVVDGWRHWHWCHLSWPGRARAPIWSLAVHLLWLIPNPSSNRERALPVGSCQWESLQSNPTPKVASHSLQAWPWEWRGRYKIECFPKVEKHRAHNRTVTVGVPVPVALWSMLIRACALLELGTVRYWFQSISQRQTLPQLWKELGSKKWSSGVCLTNLRDCESELL